MAAKTNAERQDAMRQRLKEAGLTEVRGIFTDPANHRAIKDFSAKLDAPDLAEPTIQRDG